VIAHIGGIPVEESLLQLAPAGVGLLVGLRVAVAHLVSRLRGGG
jgi:hypothetical protein